MEIASAIAALMRSDFAIQEPVLLTLSYSNPCSQWAGENPLSIWNQCYNKSILTP